MMPQFIKYRMRLHDTDTGFLHTGCGRSVSVRTDCSGELLKRCICNGRRAEGCIEYCMFPNCLDPEILGEILRGGADKVLEAGAVLVGGHSVQDDEPKYGLSVTGFVHPDKIYKNYGCQPGDVLVLTKQLGSGIVNTTVKAQMASEAAADEAVKVMASLNQRAKRAIEKHTIHACTDVTGFGLLGHCTEMAEASDMTLELYPEQIEYMTEAIAYAGWDSFRQEHIRTGSLQRKDWMQET